MCCLFDGSVCVNSVALFIKYGVDLRLFVCCFSFLGVLLFVAAVCSVGLLGDVVACLILICLRVKVTDCCLFVVC